ncbi:hypothetical protein HK107_01475 [Parvularcula sp. ZS-1/3]|uniref:Uncharacterized protein n=1 Tax=Parvularcula mediterranea TaxID=2732508 RepID=A0A7Y3W408_9PROT|nr:hypothetical protein [Parvularcula mediterranea]NNU14993.1 hypothetical protein [Parvularcula mediterranea]
MTKPGKASISVGIIALGLLLAGVAVKLAVGTSEGAPRLLTMGSFGLLLAVLGNLVPKLAPLRDGTSDFGYRNAGRVLFLTGLAVLGTALLAPAEVMLSAASLIGLVGLALAGFSALPSSRNKDTQSMPTRSDQMKTAILLLFVGLAGAFGLILLDRLFGDQVAQWSAIVWVLILGVVATTRLSDFKRRN